MSDVQQQTDLNASDLVQNKSSTWLILSVLFITTVFLLWNTWVRQQDYIEQEYNSVKNSVNGTSREIITIFSEFRRSVKLLGERERTLLRKIADNPNDIDAYDTLVEKVKNVFPESFAVTLADSNGEPFIEDFDGFIVEICKKDISNFAHENHPPDVYIHPNSFMYHFDIMARLDLGFEEESIFFISFKPDKIAKLLATSQLYQHKLYLLKQDKPGLVEIVSEGSRQNLKEKQFFLTDEQQESISYLIPVEGTFWNLASMPKEGIVSNTLIKLWSEVLIQFLFLLIISVFIIKSLQRSENKIIEQNKDLSSHAHELILNEKRLEKAQQIANMGHWDYNLANDALHFSEGSYAIFKIDPEMHITSHQIMQKIYPVDRARIRRIIASSIVKRRPYQAEFRIISDDGSIRILSASVELTLDVNNNPLQLFGVVQDITERKKAEEEGKNALVAKLDAESASEAKSEFLANMSHEIRTPLTAVIGFAETLLHSDQPMEERTNAIRTIIRNGDHLLNIINDILDLSKIEAEKFEVENVKLSPFTILSEVESLIRIQTNEKGLDFTVNYIFPLPAFIFSDALRLKQILINLCNNALKFTQNGFIHVNTGYDSNYSEIWFEVIDTGIGMSKNELEKIFSTFTQADLSTTKKYGGTGLGLTISKHLTEMLDGNITVNSQPGKGSQFMVTIKTGELGDIPLIHNINQLPKVPEPHLVYRQNDSLRGSVLLAEDNEDNQRLLSLYLKKMGADVTIVPDGKQALDTAFTSQFDLILMDMQMPVMDGMEAVQQLRKKNYNKPIVALTANAMQTDRDRCISLGCDEFISKPIRRNDLFKVVSQYLRMVKAEEKKYPPIYSTLIEEEPELEDIVHRFVDNLPKTIKLMLNSVSNSNWDELKSLTHQLKGVGGGYGYPMLTEISAKIQFQLENNNYEEVNSLANELEQLCQQIYEGIFPKTISVA